MLRLFTTTIFVLFISSSLLAQIPNPGFESWVNGDPEGWITFDITGLGDAVTQTSDSHTGSSAAKMEILDIIGSPFPPFLFSAQIGVSEKFGSLTGYFKFVPIDANGFFDVAVAMYKGTNPVGVGEWGTYQTTSSYTQFVVPIEYINGEIPDSAIIYFLVDDTTESGTGGIGSYAIVDDLSFGGPTDVNDKASSVNSFELSQNYPNPFNPSTTISYQLPTSGQVTLNVYNILGDEVASLVNEEKPAGSYEVKFDASHLSSGVYFYKLQTGSFIETKKMMLLK